MPSDERLPFIVDRILPAREIHLIAGPSGAGKTTFLFQMIQDWSQGKEILGHASHPLPFVYVSCDRSRASTHRTLERLGIPADSLPTISLVEKREVSSIHGLIGAARQIVPDARVLFIDAIAVLVKDGKTNDYAIVANFLRDCGAICASQDITIVALVHAAKVKEGERFLNPRQRILGSVAWAGFSDTVILIEPSDPEDPANNERSLLVLPRNAPGEELTYAFNEYGRLEPVTLAEVAHDLLDMKVWPLLKESTIYTFVTILMMAAEQGIQISKKTLRRWLAGKIDSGNIVQPKRGTYQRPLKT